MLKGMNKKDALASANYWLERLEMTKYAKSKLETLSKGNQQKIQLIVALIADPKIVILDEPFSGLDPVNAMILKEIVKELIAQDKIVLFSSHQMNYIEEFCDDIAILNGGEIVLSGDIKDIKRNYDRNKIVITSLDFHNIAFFSEETCKDIVKNIEKLEDNKVMLTLSNEYNKEKLLQRLAEQHFDIDKFEVYEPTLNDIFVEYTEDRI